MENPAYAYCNLGRSMVYSVRVWGMDAWTKRDVLVYGRNQRRIAQPGKLGSNGAVKYFVMKQKVKKE